MFGGLAFPMDRHMALCAISGGALMFRVDPACTDALLAKPAAGATHRLDSSRSRSAWSETPPKTT